MALPSVEAVLVKVTSTAERQVEDCKGTLQKGRHFPAVAYADFHRPLWGGQARRPKATTSRSIHLNGRND